MCSMKRWYKEYSKGKIELTKGLRKKSNEGGQKIEIFAMNIKLEKWGWIVSYGGVWERVLLDRIYKKIFFETNIF